MPSGSGDHVFVRIEKRELTTLQAARAIAVALGIRDRDIGIAGMKDRHAVTRQWLSLPPPVTPEQALALSLEGVQILEARRHPHKLRTGHVRANRFVLRVTGVVPDAEARARAILGALAAAPGAPNWYGEQRFGRDGDNAAIGREVLAGKRMRDARTARLMVSALQSQLFNDWLTARLADGLYCEVLAGDLLHKRGGGMFTCEDPATDRGRLLAGELCVTGPMFGSKMRQPGPPAAEREAAILAAAGLEPAAFGKLAEGTRRDATIEIVDPTVRTVDASTLEVAFSLPGGAYATTVMRELLKEQSLSVDDTPQGA